MHREQETLKFFFITCIKIVKVISTSIDVYYFDLRTAVNLKFLILCLNSMYDCLKLIVTVHWCKALVSKYREF